MGSTVVNFKASDALQKRIDEFAQAEGHSNRSAAIKAALLRATTPGDKPAVAPEDELLELLTESARGGNVTAMKELRAYHREQGEEQGSDPVDALDELAERRAQAV